MPTVQQRDVKEIFHESLRRDAGAPRERYLADACGANEGLRTEVESLLASLEEARSFLEVPIIAESDIDLGATSLSPGRMISHYKIESLLGRGGMGEVYLATDKILKRSVAVKIVPDSLSADAPCVKRFRREAEAIAVLNHPNILTIYEFATVNNKHVIVSEFIKGETVRKRLAYGPMPIPEVLDIADQTAAALAAAHSTGIIHRDIKPENIMIRYDGYVKVLDFGLAKLIACPGRDLSALVSMTSQPGIIMGTSNYVSPEQARGQDVDHRTDLFSLGVVIYEMLTGIQPFKGDTAIDVVAEIIQTDPPPVEELDGKIPEELSTVIKRLLEKDPNRRYRDAEELRRDLRSIRERYAGEPSQPDRPRSSEPNIYEMPTSEYPIPASREAPIPLYLLILSLFLVVLAALLAYRLLY